MTLLTELTNDPETLGYATAGWATPIPTLVGDPSQMKEVPHPNAAAAAKGVKVRVHANPYTQADNDARYAQAEKYQAVAAVLNDETQRPVAVKDVTDKQFSDALNSAEWSALSQADRDLVLLMQGAGNPNWKIELHKLLPDPGTSRANLAALRQSRAQELGLRRVAAGDVKRVKGDTT